jgi:hypothetical protein
VLVFRLCPLVAGGGAGDEQRDRLCRLDGRDAVVVLVPGRAKGFGPDPAGLEGTGMRLGEDGGKNEEAGDRGAA